MLSLTSDVYYKCNEYIRRREVAVGESVSGTAVGGDALVAGSCVAPPDGGSPPPVSTANHAAEHAAERGRALYEDGMYCAEVVLTVANEAAGHRLPSEVMSLGSGFWGGVAGDGSTCGALTGAIMAIGMLGGRTRIDGAWEPSAEAIAQMRSAFLERFGSMSCAGLTAQFGGMEGADRFRHCACLTGETAGMVVRLTGDRGWL